jgi:hypothetical protein
MSPVNLDVITCLPKILVKKMYKYLVFNKI